MSPLLTPLEGKSRFFRVGGLQGKVERWTLALLPPFGNKESLYLLSQSNAKPWNLEVGPGAAGWGRL